jgi:hypothetical protein
MVAVLIIFMLIVKAGEGVDDAGIALWLGEWGSSGRMMVDAAVSWSFYPLRSGIDPGEMRSNFTGRTRSGYCEVLQELRAPSDGSLPRPNQSRCIFNGVSDCSRTLIRHGAVLLLQWAHYRPCSKATSYCCHMAGITHQSIAGTNVKKA